jgi:hypothetical protein
MSRCRIGATVQIRARRADERLMDSPLGRTVAALLVVVVAYVGPYRWLSDGPETARGGDETETVSISDAERSAGLTFAASVPEADRGWILAALEKPRPEAQRLLDEVDGLVTIQTHSHMGEALGYAQFVSHRFVVSFDIEGMKADERIDPTVVVLHEMGHVIDRALVSHKLDAQLEAANPRRGTCVTTEDISGPCAAREERFADTFARWALRGAVSFGASGYNVDIPPSLEDWGLPLLKLAAQLDVDD